MVTSIVAAGWPLSSKGAKAAESTRWLDILRIQGFNRQ